MKVPGTLQYYTITVQALEALHFVTEECEIDMTESHIQFEPDVTEYLYESAAPNYNYVVKISASTGAGSGPETSVYVTTLSAGMDIFK